MENVQFGVSGKLPNMAAGAEIVGTDYRHRSDNGKNRFGALFLVLSLVAARTGKGSLRVRRRELQELGQSGRGGAVHGCAHRGLSRFQVEPAFLAPALKQNLKGAIYFALDFEVDRLRSFFSCGVKLSSTGRARQIFSFTSNRLPLRRWNRWKASTSDRALRSSAGEEKLSVTVLPPCLRVRR